MTQLSPEMIALASELLEEMAGNGLKPSFAKLYSQHTRLRAGKTGLIGWRENEASNRLDDVIRLIEAASIQKEAGNHAQWLKGMRRAGELLEWLSHPELNPEQLPIRLLAAAAYQLAGYPARASGLLIEDATETTESEILRSLLKADFPELLRKLTEYWEREFSTETDLALNNPDEFHQIIVRETASSLGILCASMRWGNEPRLPRAIDKLSAVEKLLLHGYNPYSWLLARLCAQVVHVYVESSMRHYLKELVQNVSPTGRTVFERYLRQSYMSCRTLAWPSQIQGIERLVGQESFALCTPTGSGKTTIAELAILQSLFLDSNNSNLTPLVIYLVPSRALATEVESKLSRILRRIKTNNQKVVVTGLYGGTDWGPTDAWLTSEEKTVLICTYEKAEALMKFLGHIFLPRVSLVVIDEAHTVQFDGNINSLQKSENRALRLESLGTRLFTYLNRNSRSRIIALSAVASELEGALASWISGQTNASPAKTSYRSTRQLIGRLECLRGRGFRISYDLLDGARLEFEEDGQTDTPFIPQPFANYPPAGKLEKEDKSPETRLRPYLFWAAMNLAAPDETGKQSAVLISITQKPGGYAEDFLYLLNTPWKNFELPRFFQPSCEPSKIKIYQKCLESCRDYFTEESREYKLLEKGIVVHHGKMPGLMARLLIELIDERIVHLVLATSTLSEGVNLPFETVLIPSLQRYQNRHWINLSFREFSNLVGRAGRPGFGTEGRSLVLLHEEQSSTDYKIKAKRRQYFDLIQNLQEKQEINNNYNPQSPLAELLINLEKQWQKISPSTNRVEFINWLEQTAPLQGSNELDEEELSAIEMLDSLDNVLLSSIVEIEQIAAQDLSADELEERLQRIWQRSYAYYASHEQTRLEEFFIKRGKALKIQIYPDSFQRRRLYRTSLPPCSGNQLLSLYPSIKEDLARGSEYAIWSDNERLDYIQAVIEKIQTISQFNLKEPPRSSRRSKNPVTWSQILHWWLAPRYASRQPTKTQISDWHGYISQNFQYRFNWGLGSIIALAIDEAFEGQFLEPSLENWAETGLPWIVFWLKELIVWGTLEPVAAYLLARVDEVTTRNRAEELAKTYYQFGSVQAKSPNEQLNAQSIRDWSEQSFSDLAQKKSKPRPSSQIQVDLLRDFSNAPSQSWKVLPVVINNEIYWFDPAGFQLAKSQKPKDWQSNYLNQYDFTLDANQQIVFSRNYL